MIHVLSDTIIEHEITVYQLQYNIIVGMVHNVQCHGTAPLYHG